MSDPVKQFLAAREYWADPNRRDEMTDLLTAAVLNPGAAPREKILDLLIRAKAACLLLPDDAYHQLASGNEPGWLASMAHLAAKDPNPAGRLEATRWLQFGRRDGAVSQEDLDTLRTLLLDPDEDVRAAASYPLEAMARDDPERVCQLVFSIVKKLKKTDRRFVVSALVPAWDSDNSRRVFELQREEFRDPKTRAQAMVSLESAIKREPPSLRGAEAAWDELLLPMVELILSGEWQRGKPVADTAPLNIMGRLLALRPARSIVDRAEAAIGRLISRRDCAMAPDIIPLGPWRCLGEYARVIWPRYVEWWRRQLDRIGKADQDRLWFLDSSRENFRRLSTAKGSDSIPPERLDTFRRSALRFVAEHAETVRAKS